MRIRWLAATLLDLEQIETHVAEDRPAAAVEVVLKIIRAVSLLGEQPGTGRPGRVPGTRELVIPGLPYIAPYRVKDKVMQILRVYHTSRRWPARL